MEGWTRGLPLASFLATVGAAEEEEEDEEDAGLAEGVGASGVVLGFRGDCGARRVGVGARAEEGAGASREGEALDGAGLREQGAMDDDAKGC